MPDKLLVNVWGISINADGQLAIVASVVIVVVLAFTMLVRRAR